MAEQDEGRTGRMSSRDTAQLGGQIAELARAGLPLPSGLRALGEELPRGRLRRMLNDLARSMEGGASLETAIAAEGARLPPHLRGLVMAGERTGRMGEVLGRFAGYANVNTEVRRQLWLSLAYPTLSLTMAFLLMLFVLTFLVSGFETIIQDFGLSVSLLTQFLIALSTTLRSSFPGLVTVTVTLAALAVVTMRVISPASRRSVASRIPLLGPVWRWTSLAEFCHLMGLLLESDVPLVEALPLAGEGVTDADVHSASRKLKQELEGGASFSAAIGRRSFFPEGLAQIVAWAETHQSLASTLHMLGEMFEARARSQAIFASTVFSVLTLLIVLGGIMLVIFGLLLPMIQLIQKLSG